MYAKSCGGARRRERSPAAECADSRSSRSSSVDLKARTTRSCNNGTRVLPTRLPARDAQRALTDRVWCGSYAKSVFRVRTYYHAATETRVHLPLGTTQSRRTMVVNDARWDHGDERHQQGTEQHYTVRTETEPGKGSMPCDIWNVNYGFVGAQRSLCHTLLYKLQGQITLIRRTQTSPKPDLTIDTGRLWNRFESQSMFGRTHRAVSDGVVQYSHSSEYNGNYEWSDPAGGEVRGRTERWQERQPYKNT